MPLRGALGAVNATLDGLAATYLQPWASSGVTQADVDEAHLRWADYRDPEWGNYVPLGKASNRLLRIIILNNRLHYIGCVGPRSKRRLVRQRAALQLLRSVLDQHALPDVDFVLSISDRPTVPRRAVPASRVPPLVFGYTRTLWHHSVPFPSVSFDPLPWASLHARLGQSPPLGRRRPQALWRGNCNSLCDMRKHSCSLPRDASLLSRAMLLHAASRCPALVDAGVTSAHRNCRGFKAKEPVPMRGHARHAFLVHVDGNGFSGRLDELLTLGAAILKQDSPFAAFYYPLLRAGFEYERIRANLTDLCSTAQSLQKGLLRAAAPGGSRAELLASHAERFARTHLSPRAVASYVASLVRRYAALQRFKPRLHPHAVVWETPPHAARRKEGGQGEPFRKVCDPPDDPGCCRRHPRACAPTRT